MTTVTDADRLLNKKKQQVKNKCVFSLLRRLSARHCPHLLLSKAPAARRRCCRALWRLLYIALAAGTRRPRPRLYTQQQTRRTPLLLSVDGTVGWRRGVVVSGVRRMNEVNARRARLVPGWVTVFGRVYHLGM